MSCNNCNLEENNDFLIQQLRREVEKLVKDTTATLLIQNGKIAEVCLYVKENLSKSISLLLSTMKESGELDDIITDAVMSSIAVLEFKTGHIINVKEYGAVGDGNCNDGLAIQKAIDDNPGKTIFIPNGTYLVDTPITLNPNQELIGQSKYGTTLKYVIDTGDLIDISNKHHISISNLSLLHDFAIEQVGASITAKAINGTKCSYAKYSNLIIKGFDYAIYCNDGSWCNDFEDIAIQSCNYGVYANGEFNNCSFIKYRATYCKNGAFIGAGRTVSFIDSQFELNEIGLVKTNLGDLYCKGSYFERNSVYDVRVYYSILPTYKVSFIDCSFFKTTGSTTNPFIYAHGDENTIVVVKNCSFTKYDVDSLLMLTSESGSNVKVLLEDNFVQEGINIHAIDMLLHNLIVRDSWSLNTAHKSIKHSHTPFFVEGNGDLTLDGKNESYRIFSNNNLNINLPEYQNNINGNSFDLCLVIPPNISFNIIGQIGDKINNSLTYYSNFGNKEGRMLSNETDITKYYYVKFSYSRDLGNAHEYIMFVVESN